MASTRTAKAVPTPTCFMNTICEVANAPMAMQNRSARGRDDPTRPANAYRDGFGVIEPRVAGFFYAREEEDAVVGREPEGDDHDQYRLRRVERALARVAEQAL